jgi:PelA/Pel-15E family pectate lyase
LETSQPFLCRRDGTTVYRLEEISFERRIGYAWYGYWPEAAFRMYPEWRKTVVVQ